VIDCIAGYHLNPWTCGIAKFNAILAKYLDVEVVGIRAVELGAYERPLLSVKISEFSDRDAADLDLWTSAHRGRFELFLHAFDRTAIECRMVAAAARVYVGNAELNRDLAQLRPDVQELFCPGRFSTRSGSCRPRSRCSPSGWRTRSGSRCNRRLHQLLEATGKTYSMYVSTALHENTSFDGSFVVTFEELQSIFNGQVYFMGYLSDTAVFNHLLDSTYLAAFFEKGLRANNTTVNAAMECGSTVITNLDEHSPAGLTHMQNVIDINRCDRLPLAEESARIGLSARSVALSQYGWDQLVSQLRAVVPAK
jgi:hypothetical protein